ncbi:MAG: hypothetical protein Q9211_003006 [Gyalolechia sp. 1 TL-2023]
MYSTRLRKGFGYPSGDDSGNDMPDELDEEGYILHSTPTTHETRGENVPTTLGPQAPFRAYAGYLNGVLSLLVGLNVLYFNGKDGVDDGFRLLCVLPGVVFPITTLARRSMRSVDIESLEKLKYPYKGA